jgi:hypothetical protein
VGRTVVEKLNTSLACYRCTTFFGEILFGLGIDFSLTLIVSSRNGMWIDMCDPEHGYHVEPYGFVKGREVC